MKETLAGIATRTGFSIATVSRVLSNQSQKYRISDKTSEIILKEARRCHYARNVSEQILRKTKTDAVGLLLPSVSNIFFAELADVIIEELDKRGYLTIVMATMEKEDKFRQCLLNLASRQVSGIIAVPCGASNIPLLEQIDKNSAPVVLIDRSAHESSLSFVTTNNYQGALDGTKELIKKGHRRIVCIQGKTDSSTNKDRVSGYKDAMAQAGLQENILICGNEFSIQNGYLETKLLLAGDESLRPSALFALSNMIAMGAMKAIQEAGLRIPQDIALITFDNNTYLDFMQPSLTRISQATNDMAILAVKILFDKIDHTSVGNTALKLIPSLIPGDSV